MARRKSVHRMIDATLNVEKEERPLNGTARSEQNLRVVDHTDSQQEATKQKTTKPKATKRKQDQAKRPFSDSEIGEVAGQVWVAIADEGPMSLAAIKRVVNAPDAHVMAGIGWLARENKLLFSNQGRVTRLSLQ